MYNILASFESIVNNILGIGTLIIMLIIIFHLACPIIAGVVAHNKNRTVLGWMLCVMIFGIIGLIIILALPDAQPKITYYKKGWRCKFCGAVNATILTSCYNCKNKKEEITVMPKVQVQVNNEKWNCSNCGSENGGNSSICWKCKITRY